MLLTKSCAFWDCESRIVTYLVRWWRTGRKDRTSPNTKNLCFTSSLSISNGRLLINIVFSKSPSFLFIFWCEGSALWPNLEVICISLTSKADFETSSWDGSCASPEDLISLSSTFFATTSSESISIWRLFSYTSESRSFPLSCSWESPSLLSSTSLVTKLFSLRSSSLSLSSDCPAALNHLKKKKD